VIRLFREMHADLQQLHQQKVIVGDLNDHNIHLQMTTNTGGQRPVGIFWIDVDSYQFGNHPCPVAMRAFLDPSLYGVSDLSSRQHFSTLTDWYAYSILLVKCLLQTHPYGGVHHRYKTLESRAMAKVSILDPAVTYPRRARPLESLTDDLLHHIHLVFEEGIRKPFPAKLLDQYALSLSICSQCGLFHPAQRPTCPACHQTTPIGRRTRDTGSQGRRPILQIDGLIEFVAVQPDGRIVTVVSAGESFKLVRAGIGGKLDEISLFEGRSSYRFGFFNALGSGQHLVVNPSNDSQLLVLDVTGRRPHQVALLESARFGDTAVLATTAHHLFRISGNWIMRGGVQDGQYLEDPVATAHKAQTWFGASSTGSTIAGYHRVFAEQHFFLIDSSKSCFDIPIPSNVPGESVAEISIAFGPRSVAIMKRVSMSGRFRTDTCVCNLRGEIVHRYSQVFDDSSLEFRTSLFPFATDLLRPSPPHIPLPNSLDLAGDEVLHAHPDGILIQQAHRLDLFKLTTRT
jgi:hypothetical protein